MSLLNRASHGNHSVLVAIFKLLQTEKKRLTTENVQNLCAPGEVGDKAKVRQTINAWLALGMLQEVDERITIHEDVRKDERAIDALPHLARRLILRSENNSNLWAKEDARASEFVRGICWALAQDVWTVSMDSWDEIQTLIQQQLGSGSTEIFQNSVNWKGFKAWAAYLGFAWCSTKSSSGIIVDPTQAVRSILPGVFGRRKNLEAAEFLKAISSEIPVLDGGVYRVEVESRLRKERDGPLVWSPPPNNQISTSLSQSILRLIADGTLVGDNKADSDEAIRITLTGRNQSKLKTFSHFSRA